MISLRPTEILKLERLDEGEMRNYYYLRLCQSKTYLPLEEYIGRDGIIGSRENLNELLTFDSREAAGEFLDQHCSKYPSRIIQICYHIGKDNSHSSGIIRI